jgi:ESS family glutamate:Na+ symporter
LVITLANLWETLLLSLGGAGLTLLGVNLVLGRVCRERNIGREAALFGFLTGTISSSIALIRVLDPDLEDPFIRDLAYAGGLSFIVALPLFFFMNFPVFGGLSYLAAAAGLAALYGGLLFCGWYFLIFRKGRV